jgi:hypothetical protein
LVIPSFDALAASIDDIGVEEGAAAILDGGEGDLDAEGGTVGTVGRHGFEHVGYGDDATAKQEVSAPTPGGVAGTVDAFVMFQDHSSDGPREVDGGHDVVPSLWVELDQLELG